jgi:hypothetical protein
MSRTRRPRLQLRLRWQSRAARRERSLSRRAHRNRCRQKLRRHPRRLREVNRDHGRRAVVAAVEVAAEVVRGRERLRQHPQSPQKPPR